MSNLRSALVAVVSVCLLAAAATTTGSTPAQAAPNGPTVRPDVAVHPTRVEPRTGAADLTAAAAAKAMPRAVWPAAGTGTVKLTNASAAGRTLARGVAAPAPSLARSWVRASGIPVMVARSARGSGPSSVRASVLPQKAAQVAGVPGVLLRVANASGPAGNVDVRVSYAAFATAVGGDWASRLRLVRLPACALTTPDKAACRIQTPLASANDTKSSAVSAQVPLSAASTSPSAGTVLALTAGSSGPAGDYKATSLAAASSWQVSPQTGAFAWSYPMTVPPTQGGPAPQLAISYNSQAVDGRTASTNNQPSWVGEGQDLATGFVERSYAGCADDMTNGINTVKTGDLCWKSDNATIVFNGRSTELVKASTGVWRLKDDDGARVTRAVAPWANGDAEKEYWLLTDTDGTKYYFGYNQRYAADTARTNSVWTVPVAFNQTGEVTGLGGTTPACARHSTFVASFCVKGWRWNLDYVVDSHGNTLTYNYAAETNRYGQNNNKTATGATGNSVAYTRGGYLTSIEYGERAGSEATTTAPQRVTFTTAERCIPSGTITCSDAQFTTANAAYWPDVPVDQVCSSTTSCPSVLAPAFFSRKRLTTVQSQVYTASAYAPVDTWTLGQSFPDPGDGTSKALWLASITHAGNVGGTATLPAVTLTGVQRQNRVDGLDGDPAMVKWRLALIKTESGGQISVNYSGPDCSKTDLPTADDTNTRRCFPQYWTREGATTPTKTYFHKYVVTSVVADDLTGGSTDQVTSYDYLGTPAWHYDDLEITPTKYRAYSDWRGYARVRVRTGDGQTPNTATETAYLRGMGGTVTDRLGSQSDADYYNGFVRESATYLGGTATSHGALVAQTFTAPVVAATTATDGTDSSRIIRPGTVRTYTPTPGAGAGTERVTQSVTAYDSDGFATQIDDAADTATTGDDRCTRITYARNTTVGIYDTVARTEVVAKACAAAVSRPADVISDVRSYFDGSTTFGAAPGKGDVTSSERVASYSGGVATYQKTSTTTYDVYGRATSVADAAGKATTTAYTPASGGPVTGTTVTNPLGHATTSVLSAQRGQVTTTTDPNGKITDLAYDPLGRLTSVWLPGRAKATQSANLKYAYTISQTAPNAVATSELRNNGTYTLTYSLMDGLLRPRLTQEPAEGTAGGRVLTETVYDSRGLTTDTKGPYYATGAPDATMYSITDAQIPSATRVTYDGAGRPVTAALLANGTEKWHTTTTYGGDRTSTTPPTGGTPTTTLVDAHGQTTQLWQYHGATAAGTAADADITTYAYTTAGQLAQVTDPAGNQWSYTYDLRGRRTGTHDPDKGDSTATYDNLDRLVTTTDAAGHTLATTYDDLGRRTSLRDTSVTGPVRALWAYDPAGAKGQLASATRRLTIAGTSYDYVQSVGSYNNWYQPLTQTLTVPNVGGVEAPLAGTYTTTNTYNLDGGLASTKFPSITGSPNETLSYTYDALGNPDTMGGYGAYVSDTQYSALGQVTRLATGNKVGKAIWLGYEYDQATGQLTRSRLDREGQAQPDVDTRYLYDPAGKLVQESNLSPTDASWAGSRCYRYDYLQRLTAAWTTATTATASPTSCSASPTSATVTGPAPYWTSYSFDLAGNRTSTTAHSLTGGADAVTTASFPVAGSVRPHALAGTATTAGAGTAANAPLAGAGSYGYDAVGNLTSRSVPKVGGGSTTQALGWDAEGHVSSVTDTATGAVTSYLYDADGARLLRREPGAVTLTIGTTDLRVDTATGAKSSTRYYSYAGRPVAVRSVLDVRFIASDPHGTGEVDVNGSTLAITRRPLDPFGVPLTSGAGWVGERGFVGGTVDASTGLTHLGAREYEPALGRFISVDPVVDPGDPQQLNGYAYANNAPTVQTDPTGLRSETIGDDYGHQTYVGGGHRQTSPANVVTVHRQRPDNSRNHLGRQRPAGDGGRNALPSGPREKYDQDVAAGRQSPAGGYGDCDSGCLAKIFAATIGVPAVAAAGTACVFSGACETGTLATAASPLCVRFCESAANLASGLLGGDPSPYGNATKAANAGPRVLAASSRVAPWAGSSLSRVSREGEVMYRVWGGGAEKAGSWLTPINPISSAAAREGLALPAENGALYVSRVTLPAGVRMQVGTAGEAFGQPGGWAQAQLLERIPLSSFGKGVPLQ